MKRAGISAASFRTLLSAGCSLVCMASKSSTPSRSITISPSSADRGGSRSLELAELRKIAEQRPAVPGPEPQLARGILEQAAEAVPLRLELPSVPVRQLAHELRLHGRKRDALSRSAGRSGAS